MPITNSQDRQRGVAILRLSGRFDAYQTSHVRSWLEQQISRQQSRLILNLEEVTFIDAPALALLVQARQRCQAAGGDLHLCSLRPSVRIICELTRVAQAMATFGTEQEAIESLVPQSGLAMPIATAYLQHRSTASLPSSHAGTAGQDSGPRPHAAASCHALFHTMQSWRQKFGTLKLAHKTSAALLAPQHTLSREEIWAE